MFNLHELKEFNPAIVYTNDVEASPALEAGSDALQDSLYPTIDQLHDLFNGYQFAETKILPFIKKNGREAVTEQQFLEWILTLHGAIGKTILELWNKKAGSYAEEGIALWHQGRMVSEHLMRYFSKCYRGMTEVQLAQLIHKEHEVEVSEILDFIKLMQKVRGLSDVMLPESEDKHLREICGNTYEGTVLLRRLFLAYRSNALTPVEKAIVNKIVMLGEDPKEIPNAMSVYARNTLKEFKACNGEDLKAVSAFLAKLFTRFTEIHPFGNANGRVATCIMNIFLRSLDLPSIVLRQVGENTDPKSPYSLAMDRLKTSTDMLEKLIYQRIIAAKKEAYSAPEREKVVELRVQFVVLARRIETMDRAYNCDVIKHMACDTPVCRAALQGATAYSDRIGIVMMEQMLLIAQRIESQLTSLKKAPVFSLAAQLSEEQKSKLMSGLIQLSGQSGWKVNQKNGLVTWVELSDKSVAREVESKLSRSGVAVVTLATRKDNPTISVVKCEQINFKTLVDIVESEKIERVKESLAQASL